MKKKFVEKGYNFIARYQECDRIKTIRIRYGLEAFYNLLTKAIFLFIVTYCFGLLKEYLLLCVVYSLARRHTYGLHAKSTIICWITTIPIYLGGCFFIRFAEIQMPIVTALWLWSFLSFLLWAPADTPSTPLIREEVRKKQKFKACLICIVFLIILVLFPYRIIINTICYSLVVQSITINPITYWITNTPYNNYKTYLKNHGLNC